MYLQLLQFRNKMVRTHPGLIVDLFPETEGVEVFFNFPDGRISGEMFLHDMFDETGMWSGWDEYAVEREKFIADNM